MRVGHRKASAEHEWACVGHTQTSVRHTWGSVGHLSTSDGLLDSALYHP